MNEFILSVGDVVKLIEAHGLTFATALQQATDASMQKDEAFEERHSVILAMFVVYRTMLMEFDKKDVKRIRKFIEHLVDAESAKMRGIADDFHDSMDILKNMLRIK